MSLRHDVRAAIAETDADGICLVKDLIRAGYTVYFVQETKDGHRGIDRRGGLAVDLFGKGFINFRDARAEFERHPDALIGVSRPYDAERVVVNPGDKTMVRERHVVNVSREAAPAVKRDRVAGKREAEETPPPQAPSIDDALAAVRDAIATKARLESEALARRRAVLAIERRRREAEQSLARARKKFGDAAADAVVKGEEIPDLPRLRNAIMKSEAEIAGCGPALASAREQIKPAEATLAQHNRALADAALNLDAALAAAALPAVTDAMAALVEPLAALAAVSVVREQLLGARFPFDPRRHAQPVGARQIVAAFLDAIPPSLRSDGMAADAIEARASEIAAAHLSQIQPQ